MNLPFKQKIIVTFHSTLTLLQLYRSQKQLSKVGWVQWKHKARMYTRSRSCFSFPLQGPRRCRFLQAGKVGAILVLSQIQSLHYYLQLDILLPELGPVCYLKWLQNILTKRSKQKYHQLEVFILGPRNIITTEYILERWWETKIKLCFDYVRSRACSTYWLHTDWALNSLVWIQKF